MFFYVVSRLRSYQYQVLLKLIINPSAEQAAGMLLSKNAMSFLSSSLSSAFVVRGNGNPGKKV